MADLQNVLIDLCLRVGYTVDEIDVTDISGTVDGFVLSNRSSARSVIEVLEQAFFIQAVESGGKIKFVPLNQSPSVTVSTDELLPVTKDKYLITGIMDNRGLARTLSVNYVARNADYQQGTQQAIRQIVDTGEVQTVTLPIVMSDDKARQTAETLLYEAWVTSTTYHFALTIKYLRIEPGDIINITDGGFTHVIRIMKKQVSGNMIVFEGQAADTSTYTQVVSGGEVVVPAGSVFNPGDTIIHYLDLPALRAIDNDIGFYVVAGREETSWRGCYIYRSTDDISYALLDTIASPTIMGETLSTLGDASSHFMDYENYIDVEILIDGQLTSTTLDNLLDSYNSCVIGDEIVQFLTAELIDTRQYRLSGLLRGRMGTEWATSTHTTGERFVMINPGANFERIIDGSSLINASRYYKAVSVGQDITDVVSESFTNTARCLKCFAPSHFEGELDGNDWVFTWIRRTRFNGAWLDYVDVPLNEEREEYTLQILDGSDNVLRTITVSDASTYTYTEADQIIDFGSGQSTINVKVAQNNAVIGPGYFTTGEF